MRVLAVIPARGGSKGLPGKNVRELAGLPLIVHSLRCGARSPSVTRVIISTDDEEIASVARAWGGDVPFVRPAELARDDTPMMPVLRHALETVEAQEGRAYDALLLLDPTSPCRTPEDVEGILARLSAEETLDGVIACSEPTFNPFWVGVVERGGLLAPAFDGAGYERRQDVPRFLRINGAAYAWRRSFIQTGRSWTTGRHAGFEIPEGRAFSIDTLHEFQILEALVRADLVKLPWLEANEGGPR